MSRRILVIALALILVVGGGVYAYRQILPSGGSEGISYATAEVRRGDLTVGVTARGMLNPTHGGSIQTPYPKGPIHFDFSWNFVVTEIYAREGDEVTRGQPILRLSASQIEPRVQEMEDDLAQRRQNLADRLGIAISEIYSVNPAKGIVLRAPIGGRVTGLELEEGDSVDQGRPVARVVDDTRWKMTVKMTPWEFAQVKQGDKMLVRFSEFAGSVVGTVTKINPNPVPERASNLLDCRTKSRDSADNSIQFVYWVTVEGHNPGLIMPGMQGEVGLPPRGMEGSLDDLAAAATWMRYCALVDSYGSEERIISTASGIVSAIFVQEMEYVKAGDPIASLSGEETQRSIERDIENIRHLETQLQQIRAFAEELTVPAPMDGIVADIQVDVGQQIEPWQWLGSIYNPMRMQMYVQIDDMDILYVQPGAQVRITMDALPGEQFEGKVMNVSTSGRDISGVAYFDAWIEVQGSSQVRPGMQAQAYIEAGHVENVLLVPIEAIFQEDRQYMVEILEADGTTRIVPIQVGLMGEFEAEIQSGLEEGQLVVTGSSRDILPSRTAPDSLLPIPGN